MNRTPYLLLLIINLILFISACENDSAGNQPVEDLYLWSHNDYEQPKPLHTALDLGFQMIEADIHLIDGNIYVIHDHPENLDETPLLDELYLAPLKEIVEKNNGKVHPDFSNPVYLVIDVKTEAEPTYAALLNMLKSYKELLYRKQEGEWIEGPVLILISGNRPSLHADSPEQMVFLDGRLDNIGMGFSSDLYPLISDNWNNYFTWDGTGEFPEDELEKLRDYVAGAHKEEKMIRFWATPDREEVWLTLINNGVDVINVDDLQGMRNFLDQLVK